MSENENASRFKGVVKTNPDLFGDQDPLDTSAVRDIQSSLDSLYYNSFQTRVNFTTEETGSVQATIYDDNLRYRIATFGPFPLTIRKDGTPAPLYVQFYPTVNSAYGTFYFNILLRREDEPPRFTYGPNLGNITVTTANHNQIINANGTGSVLYYPSSGMRMARSVKTRTDRFGTRESTPSVPLFYLDAFVWAITPLSGTASVGTAAIQQLYAYENPFMGE